MAEGDVWGKDGLNHRYCTAEICKADGSDTSNVGCPKHGPTGHDCNY